MSSLLPNLLSVLVLAAFIQRRWMQTRSFIEPGIVFAANLMLLYPIRGLILSLYNDNAVPNYPGLSTANHLEQSSWLATLGCVGFVCGYLLVIKGRKLTILQGTARPGRPDDLLVCSVFFAASLLGIAYKIATGDYISYLMSDTRMPALSHVGAMLTDLQWPAYIGVWAMWFRGLRKPGFVALFVTMQSVVIPYQFIQGSKTYLSLLLVSIVLAYYWSRAKLPKATTLAAVAIVIFFVFPYVHTFREFINQKYGRIPEFSALDFRGFKSMYAEDEPTSAQDELFAVSARYGGIDELYNITEVVPGLLPYRFGTEYSAFFINLVPRAVWPDKPVFSRGVVYGAALNTITSVTPFPFGEAYWDMGVLGLLVSMTIWGACLAGVVLSYEHFYRKPALSFLIGLFFLSQIYWITGGESSMPEVISGLPQQIALLWFLYLMLRSLSPWQNWQASHLRVQCSD